ncbi:MAG: MurR/RpiR family transcriptional regulator [Bacillota bacterium]
MAEEGIFEKITAQYYTLTGSEKKVADYILHQREKTQYMSITDLAEHCLVAEATVTRFCKSLGYKGYNALKLAVANATAKQGSHQATPGAISETDSVEEVCQKCATFSIEAINQTLEVLNPTVIATAATLLSQANCVLCMGQGGSMLLAQQAAHLFSTTFPNFYAIADSHAQMIAISHLQKGDVALIFSYSGSTAELEAMLRVVGEKEAISILVTRFPKSPGGMKADMILPCGANEAPLQLGSVPAAVSQLILLDSLYQELCRRDFENTNRKREEVARALLEKHL